MTSADALAELLDLDAHDTPICLACLSDVVFTLDNRDVGKINGRLPRWRLISGRKVSSTRAARLASSARERDRRRGPRARRRRCERAA